MSDVETFREKYYNEHQFCPECSGDNYDETLTSYIIDPSNMDKFADNNRIRCKCGWRGTRHELVQFGNKSVSTDV